MSNILLETNFNTKYNTYPFSKIKNHDYLTALKAAIKEAKQILDTMKNSNSVHFDDIINAFEDADDRISLVTQIFFNLHSAESDEELRSLAKEISPLLSDYSNDIQFDELLFKKIKILYDQIDTLELSPEQRTVLEESYKGFLRNGALLNNADKNQLRKITKKLSELSLHYSDNILKDKNQFELLLTHDDLEGLQEDYIASCLIAAKEKGHDGKYLINLDFPSYLPFMQYSSRDDLRKKLYTAMATVASKDNEFNNIHHCQEIATLRLKKSHLLGFNSHAEYVLQERMAENPNKVYDFTNELLEASLPIAQEEIKKIMAFKKLKIGKNDLYPWSFHYWSRLYKQEEFGFDPEDLRPYFKLEQVIEGAFLIASKLYDLEFKKSNIEGYHPDVTTFEVFDRKSNNLIGILYADFFPREGKRAGAWMTTFREQRIIKNKDRRPHVSIVCNFTKPIEDKPSLLMFGEVTTLFHEFGHALHGLLSKCRYKSVAGTNVFWDFVELPSQVMENWCYEKESLDLFAEHFETNEKIPETLVQKLNDSRKFLEGYQCVRQLSFALLDMSWHDVKKVSGLTDIAKIEKYAKEKTELLPDDVDGFKSCSFSHIFSGGYSAAYYSYKWAEVLDADTFATFKEKGIFNKEISSKFKKEILEKGGSEHPMILYKRFRGQEPNTSALLKRSGF